MGDGRVHDYDEMVGGLNEAANRGARIAEALVPHLAETLGLEEPYGLSFSEMTLARTSGDCYQFSINVKPE